jgi:hypothetical protein
VSGLEGGGKSLQKPMADSCGKEEAVVEKDKG